MVRAQITEGAHQPAGDQGACIARSRRRGGGGLQEARARVEAANSALEVLPVAHAGDAHLLQVVASEQWQQGPIDLVPLEELPIGGVGCQVQGICPGGHLFAGPFSWIQRWWPISLGAWCTIALSAFHHKFVCVCVCCLYEEKWIVCALLVIWIVCARAKINYN